MPFKPLDEVPASHLGRTLMARALRRDPSLAGSPISWRRRRPGRVTGYPAEHHTDDAGALIAQWAHALDLRPDRGRPTPVRPAVYRGTVDGCEVVLHTSTTTVQTGAQGAIARSLMNPGLENRHQRPAAFGRCISMFDETRLIPAAAPAATSKPQDGKHAASPLRHICFHHTSASSPSPVDGCFHGVLDLR